MRNINKVEALAASWIEILIFPAFRAILQSKPLRLRGLKFLFQISKNGLKNVEALAASWIEILLAQLFVKGYPLSKPLRLRGLKSGRMCAIYPQEVVEALAASWIEMTCPVGLRTII